MVLLADVPQRGAAIAPLNVGAGERHQRLDVVGSLLAQVCRMPRRRIVKSGQRLGNARRELAQSDGLAPIDQPACRTMISSQSLFHFADSSSTVAGSMNLSCSF